MRPRDTRSFILAQILNKLEVLDFYRIGNYGEISFRGIPSVNILGQILEEGSNSDDPLESIRVIGTN